MVDEATTYFAFVTLGSTYRLEDHEINDDIRAAIEGANGTLVDLYALAGPWDVVVIADFKSNHDIVKFRYALKTLGMWNIETTPATSVPALSKIVREPRLAARR